MPWSDKEKKEFEEHLKLRRFGKLREMLEKKITLVNLEWKAVKLDGGHTVQVCQPVRIEGPDGKMYYVPVTASETWKHARNFSALPLTSAVFDQYHNKSAYVPRSPKHDAFLNGMEFHTFSDYLNDRNYHLGLHSGAHKLWILSATQAPAGHQRSINRGIYFPKPKDPVKYKEAKNPGGPGGPKLDPSYWVMNVRGPAHGPGHWDYSQLLQLMKSDDMFGSPIIDFTDPVVKKPLRIPSIKLVDLREAVIQGLPEVWDELPNKIKPEVLP